MKTFALRMADQEHKAMIRLAKDLERSANDIVREAVRDYIRSHGREVEVKRGEKL